MSKIFALDYDNTASDDPEFWRGFIAEQQKRGHYVMIVTFRLHTRSLSDIERDFPGVEIVATNGEFKRKYLEENGYPSPSIWIDDMPELICAPVPVLG